MKRFKALELSRSQTSTSVLETYNCSSFKSSYSTERWNRNDPDRCPSTKRSFNSCWCITVQSSKCALIVKSNQNQILRPVCGDDIDNVNNGCPANKSSRLSRRCLAEQDRDLRPLVKPNKSHKLRSRTLGLNMPVQLSLFLESDQGLARNLSLGCSLNRSCG